MKRIFSILFALVLVLSFSLVPAAPAALAWQEGPGTDWWFINASMVGGNYYNTVPLVIEINGNAADFQVFTVGTPLTITSDIHAYAATAAGAHGEPHNEAITEGYLEVTGASGSDSIGLNGYHYNTPDYAEVETIGTLSISYTVTTPGIHTIKVSSKAKVRQYRQDVAEETVDASLTFNVVANFVTGGGKLNRATVSAPGPGKKPAYTFAGTVGYLPDMTLVGQFQIVDHVSRVAYHLNSFSSLSFSDTAAPAESPVATHDTATFTGSGTDNAGNPVTFTVIIQDLGEPGKGVDKIQVTGPPTFAPQVIDGGNFQVHDGYKS